MTIQAERLHKNISMLTDVVGFISSQLFVKKMNFKHTVFFLLFGKLGVVSSSVSEILRMILTTCISLVPQDQWNNFISDGMHPVKIKKHKLTCLFVCSSQDITEMHCLR